MRSSTGCTGGGTARERSVVGILGSGSGLGVSGLIPAADGWVALGTEGGHVSFAPHDEREVAILRHAWKQFSHVSFERLLSGSGLELMYRALAEHAGVKAEALSAPDITQRGLAGADRVCLETLEVFCGLLGTAAANLAVTLGSLGGIYIGGGIVPRLGEYFDRSPFRERFEDKGRFSDYVKAIPTYVITAPNATFFGASAILEAQLRTIEGSAASAILEQIRRALPGLSPAEKRVAEHVLAQPRTVLGDPIADIARAAGEDTWRLPLTDSVKEELKSDVADLKNAGDRMGGAMSAALFLQKFVKDTPWAHLDIAGTVWADKPGATWDKGATGFGVRLLEQFVRIASHDLREPVNAINHAAPALADDLPTLQKIKSSGTIVVGHRESSIPFSYLDGNQKPVGYSMDLCNKIVEEVKKELKMPALVTKLTPVTSQTRIPLMTNGTIDLECGSTTNALERQKQVAFGVTTFVSPVRMVVKADSGIKTLDDLNGKAVATTTGTTSDRYIKQNEKGHNIDVKNVYGKDHAESFLMVETGRASAFVMDEVLLAGFIANAKNPKDFAIVGPALSTEPYGIMLRKDDPQFKALVDKTLSGLMKSGEINKIYAKWFTSPIPPKNVNLNLPMNAQLQEAIKHPSDKGI